MPASLHWESKDILRVKYYGIINGNDAVDSSLAMSSDPRFDDLKGIIIDTLGITDNIASTEHVSKLVAISRLMSQKNPKIRNPIVLNEDENTGALAALYTFLADELIWDVKMFRTIDEARAWALEAPSSDD